TNPATKQEGPLAAYADYYRGLALLHLGRVVDARAVFQSIQTTAVGLLSELAALREAECDETVDDQIAAIAVYERLTAMKTTAPDDVLLKLAKAAQAAGDRDKAQAAFEKIYYDYPLSDLVDEAAAQLDDVPVSAGTIRFNQVLARAERLFGAKQYPAARSTFEKLRNVAQGEDRTLVQLRIAECDYFLHKYHTAVDQLRPFAASGARTAEALYYYALVQRELKDNALFHTLMRRVVTEFPGTLWEEDALNSLALADARDDEDDAADQESAELFERFPKGRYTERAAWRIGWHAYRRAQYAECIRIFERAAFNFPRSDYRPAWLYWSGRSHEALGETALAESRYSLGVIDYLNTYYGQLASARIGGRIPDRTTIVPARAVTEPVTDDLPTVTLPPNADVVRALLTAKMYDQAADELHYAQAIWGDLGTVEATFAWTYRQQGQTENGSRQFSFYRGSMNAMKRAYPQYLTAGGERLPREILRIIYPIAYWDLIQKYSAQNGLDPYVVAALTCQESTFVANIRSPAKAVGLMQLEAATARGLARRLGLAYSSTLLSNPEANIRMGTLYLADKIREFGSLHYALASYNAGEGRVHRWIPDRAGLSQEEFIDDMPFYETQNYVRKILATAEDYRRLYGPDTISPEDEIPPATQVVGAETADPSLNTKKKPAAKPAAPAPAKKAKTRKRTAA
ncbi:MAG TPA: lytic transglycosylase domain-containing protein, partial [Vicinamibacterales bacterium]|nr:lytic transglycosylase domain-containing protein [Vicinamibacterales bacterium]